MGMFAPEYKSPIPKYAMKVGIVTASTGSGNPRYHKYSPEAESLRAAGAMPRTGAGEKERRPVSPGDQRPLDAMGLDVLIVGRGGGSIEDLWAFNEETVARAILPAKRR